MRVTKDNVRYIVCWGESQRVGWNAYDEIDDALDACRELAEEEDLTDEERASLDVWGDGPETGWGVCPEGDTGGYGACVVAQYYAGGTWHDWPASPEEAIEIVDGPLYRVVTYLGNPAEKEHGTDLTEEEARELCEELAEEISSDRAEEPDEYDEDELEKPVLYDDTDDDGKKRGECCPPQDEADCWPVYLQV